MQRLMLPGFSLVFVALCWCYPWLLVPALVVTGAILYLHTHVCEADPSVMDCERMMRYAPPPLRLATQLGPEISTPMLFVFGEIQKTRAANPTGPVRVLEIGRRGDGSRSLAALLPEVQFDVFDPFSSDEDTTTPQRTTTTTPPNVCFRREQNVSPNQYDFVFATDRLHQLDTHDQRVRLLEWIARVMRVGCGTRLVLVDCFRRGSVMIECGSSIATRMHACLERLLGLGGSIPDRMDWMRALPVAWQQTRIRFLDLTHAARAFWEQQAREQIYHDAWFQRKIPLRAVEAKCWLYGLTHGSVEYGMLVMEHSTGYGSSMRLTEAL